MVEIQALSPCVPADQLADLVTASLSPEATRQVHNHLEGCASCRHLLSEIQEEENLAMRLRSALALDDELALRQRLAALFTGAYELLELLGRGAGGMVFKARDLKLNRFVAIKCLLPRDDAFSRVAAAMREARLCATLNHPHVAAVYSVTEGAPQSAGAAAASPDLPCIIMEFIEGLPITETLLSRPLNQQLSVFRQVLAAAAELHRRGVVHRDLKPDNILLDIRGTVKIVDFGIARSAAEAARLEGTPAYLAPEQSRGEPANPASDVFSLGVILFELLTGQRPFTGQNPGQVIAAIRDADPPLPRSLRPEIPGALQAICLTALEKSPDHRYPSAQQFLLDLDRFLSGEAVSANPHLLASVLEHGIERHVTDLERWENDRMISTRECDYFVDRYERLRQREEMWVVDSRRISFSQVMLHLGAWCCVVSAFLMLAFPWAHLSSPKPALPITLTTVLMASGLILWSRHTKRVALVLLMAGTLTSLFAAATFLVHFQLLTGGNENDLIIRNFASNYTYLTNYQFFATTLAGFLLALGLWRHTKTTAFALIWGFMAILLSTAIFSLWDLRYQLQVLRRPDTVAGRYLWPGGLFLAMAIYFDCQRRRSEFAPPLYILGLTLTLGALTAIAFFGPTPVWLNFLTLPNDQEELRWRLVKYSFMINGLLYAIVGLLIQRSKISSWLRRIGTLLLWLAPSHILIPIFRLEDEGPRLFGTDWTIPQIMLPVTALAFFFASVPKQMKSFFFSGLAYCALAVQRLTDLHFTDKFAWPISLAIGGLLLAATAWRFPAIFDARARPAKRPARAESAEPPASSAKPSGLSSGVSGSGKA